MKGYGFVILTRGLWLLLIVNETSLYRDSIRVNSVCMVSVLRVRNHVKVSCELSEM